MRLVALLVIAASVRAGEVQRIVSTAPSITETLFAMGLGPRVVGVTVYCKFPPAVVNLPKIGTYLEPNVESIVALHPDLVVVQKQANHLGDELARLHIRYIEVQSDNLDAIYAGARAIGKAADASAEAERFVRDMRTQLNDLEKLTAHLPKPSVAFIVGHEPGSLRDIFVGSGSSYFSDLLTYVGATNVFSDAATPYPSVSLENILLRNPDVIIEISGDTAENRSQVLALWQGWPSLKAVTSGHVYPVDSDLFIVPGPRMVDAAKTLAHMLHPEIRP